MAFERLSYGGGAVRTTLSADIGSSDTSLTVTAATGWPDGTNGPFNLVIIDGVDENATEEKVQATARTGNTLTGLSRGVDGSSPLAHSQGARVLHGFHASEADAANNTAHQTLGKVAATGDLLVGSGANQLARLAVGTDGLVHLADSGQATGTRWGQADSAGIAAGAITGIHITDGSVLQEKLDSRIRAYWIADDAAGIAALIPGTGDLAVQRDTHTLMGYNGTDWQVVSTKPLQSATSGGTSSGTTEMVLATIVVPALPYTYNVEGAAFWSGLLSSSTDVFAFRIKVDSTVQATQEVSGGGRVPFSIPGSTFVTIPANTSTTVTASVVRVTGAGTITEAFGGTLTVRLWPL